MTDEQRDTILTVLTNERRRAVRGIENLRRIHGARANTATLEAKVRRLDDAAAAVGRPRPGSVEEKLAILADLDPAEAERLR